MNRQLCDIQWLGSVPYGEAWERQKVLAAEIASGKRPPTLLLLEHPHTYTFGRRGRIENLLWDAAERAKRGISVHWVDRGGDVTYHGPGQLVGYPLLPLGTVNLRVSDNSTRLPQADYVGYIRKLELTLIAALAGLGVPSGQISGLTGVWAPGISIDSNTEAEIIPDEEANPQNDPQQRSAKIAAIGVKVDARGISRHGFALNVNPDMTYWQGIIGCGLVGYRMTSMAEWLDPVPKMETVIAAVTASFGKIFGYEMPTIYPDEIQV